METSQNQPKNKKNIVIIAIVILIILGGSVYWQKKKADKPGGVSAEIEEADLTQQANTAAVLNNIPSPSEQGRILISVYFGNSEFFGGTASDCKNVFVAKRNVPQTTAIAGAAIAELFNGPTKEEKAAGYFTAISRGVEIKDIVIENGIAKVNFSEALASDTDGDCKTLTAREQIIRTLKQFPTVSDVVISVN